MSSLCQAGWIIIDDKFNGLVYYKIDTISWQPMDFVKTYDTYEIPHWYYMNTGLRHIRDTTLVLYEYRNTAILRSTRCEDTLLNH